MPISDRIFNSPLVGYAKLNIIREDGSPNYHNEITYINKKLETLTGNLQTEAIGKPITSLFPELDSDEAWNTIIQELFHQGSSKSYRKYFGTLKCELEFQIWSDENDTLELFVIDINKTESPLSKDVTLEDYNYVFDNLPQSIFVIEVTENNKFKIVDFNQTQLDFLNMNRKDVQGKFFHELFPPAITERVENKYNQCLSTGKQITYEETVDLPGLEERTYLTTLTPVFGSSGQIHTIVGNSVDISTRKETEKALIREQKFNEALLDTATDGIIACDENGKLVLFNQTAKKWHGKKLKQITVKEAVEPYNLFRFDGVTPLKPEEIPLQRAYEGERIYNEEIAIKAEGQPIRYVSTAASPVHDKAGNKLGAVVIMRDITETLEQREALEKSEQRFKTLAYNTPGVIYLCENDEKYSMNFINDQVEELTGYTSDAFLNDYVSFVDLYHPDDEAKIYSIVNEALAEKKPFQISYRVKHKLGDWKWVLETGKGIYNRKGDLTQIEGYLTDITQQKKAEEIVHKANQQLSFHLDNSPLAVIISDENFNIKEWSKSAEKLFGWTEKEVLEKDPDQWKFTHKEDQKRVNEKINELVKGEMPRNLSINRNFTKDGKVLHCEWYNSVMFDSIGEIISIFSLVHDISDRIEKEHEIERSLKEKNILLAEIHHRVKNNLAVVSAMMQLQAFETENENLQNKLFDSVVRIKSIASVHEILYQSSSFSELDFAQTIKRLVDNISSTLQTNVPVEISYDIEPTNIDINKAVPAALIINEVVTNAYKHAFTERKSGEISFIIQNQNGSIEIQITDNGKGIEPSDLVESQSLGMRLIREISTQINGNYKYEKTKDGTLFRLIFEG